MSVYDDEKHSGNTKLSPSDDDLRHLTGIGHDEEGAMDQNAHNSVAGDIAQREGLTKSSPMSIGKPKASTAKELRSSENLGGGNGFYNPGGESSGGIGGRFKRTFWGSRRRKQATIGGGLTGGIVGISLFGLTLLGGTGFEFIHMAELLEHAHLSDQQDASDQEMGKLYRYAKSNGDIGETRLGFLESKMVGNMKLQLADAGLTYNTPNGKFTGFNIDTTNPDSPYAGMDEAAVKTKLAQNGITEGYTVTNESDGKFTYTLDPDSNFLQSYKTGKLTNRLLVSQADESKIPDALRVRSLDKYGFVNWHPLTELKGNINSKINKTALAAWEKTREKLIGTGQEPASIDTATAENKDAEGNLAPDGSPDVPTTDSSVASTLSKIKASNGLKITGGVAAAVGLVCTIRTVSTNIGSIRYAQDILPMMRLGTEAITVGNQVMTGGDVDPSELNYLAQQFSTKNGVSWADSQTFEADSGQPTTGQDLDTGVKNTLSETVPSWLSWADSAPVKALCSGIGSFLSGAVNVAVSVFSGDAAGAVAGIGLGAILGASGVIQDLAKIVAGDAVNVVSATGPTFGNYVNYGARYFANAGAVQDGGTALSSSDVAVLNNEQNIASQKSFDSESVADRLFDPYDYRSAISKVMDSQTSSPNQNMDNVAVGLLRLGAELITSPTKILSLFSSTVTADSSTTYNYPFPQYGFSEQDLDSTIGQADPYANAQTVATLLDNNNQNGNPDYIQDVKQCFNDTIDKDSNGLWDVVPGAAADPSGLNLYDSTQYNPQTCSDPPNVSADNWLRIRFFVFDTGVMEGYACEQGDSPSCTNDGVNTASTASSTGLSINNEAAQQAAQLASTSNGVNVGYALYNSSGTALASYNSTFENYGASITKSMLLVAYLNQVGTGSISSQAQSELTNMIENSDNASANWVYSQLSGGVDAVTKVANEAGMTSFKLDNTSDPTYILGQSQITANDFATFFSKINTLIVPSQQSFGLNLLSNLAPTDQVGLLKSGLPGTVYSKEGWKPEVAGLEGSPYVVNQAAQFTDNGITYGVAVTVAGGSTSTQATEEAVVQQVVSALIGGSGN